MTGATPLENLRAQLKKEADPAQAQSSLRFFKTGLGDYGEGDQFLGIPAAELRRLARSFSLLAFPDILALLQSPLHEERFLALLILTLKYQTGEQKMQQQVYSFYLKNICFVNNWDLVDVSAPGIVGAWLESRDRSKLSRLAKSNSLWERRIAIVSTLYFIRKQDFATTLQISERLLQDQHDLIHKAVGWMLREVGKRDEETLKLFLSQQYKLMPRTALRYAIERFPPEVRQSYLKGTV